MNNKRKNLDVKIEVNYQSYKLLQKQLLETDNFDASNKLRELYFEISRLRYDDGIEMVKEIYNL